VLSNQWPLSICKAQGTVVRKFAARLKRMRKHFIAYGTTNSIALALQQNPAKSTMVFS
jgi:hypothetical protein